MVEKLRMNELVIDYTIIIKKSVSLTARIL